MSRAFCHPGALGAAVLALALGLGAPARAGLVDPAELPPPDYAGQQYVDSKGCLFVRAGTPDAPMWLPRVTREGVPMCGNPPSGTRVPVAEDAATGNGAAVAPPPDPGAAVAPGYFVAVGSFGVAANADLALARLQALDYPALRGRVAGASGGLVTVFAGPFADRAAADQAQRDLTGAGFPDATVIAP